MKTIAGTVKDYLLVAMVWGVLGSIALGDAIPVTGQGLSDAVPEETTSTDGSRKAPGLVPHEAHFHEKLSDVEVASINSSPTRSLAQLNIKRSHHS